LIGTAPQSVAENFEQRGSRAALLASSAGAAREPLEFASALCAAQALVAKKITQPLSGRLSEDVAALLPLLQPVLRVGAEQGPEQLAVEADKRLHDQTEIAHNRLLVYWNGDAPGDYLARAMLQPYAETLRVLKIAPDRVHAKGHCPFCGGAAWISVRKPMPEADSGFRYLLCSLCGLEWSFNRGTCPSCFEAQPQNVPVFQSDAHPNVRIEACETCHRYLKSIDLTKDARPIAPIDDLLSLSMDLWAADEGYTRIEPGLAGI
jgi:formate dehydrogenase maturation protein FdhE